MIKLSCVILVGLAAAALLRRRSAAVRHSILAAAIACAAVTPMLEQVVPAWHVPARVMRLGRRAEPVTLFIPIHEVEMDPDASAASQTGLASTARAMILPWLARVWIAGIVVSVSILLIGFARLSWVASRSRRVPRGTWTALAQALSRDFGLRRPVLLLQSEHPTLLVTWGLRHPKIVLPEAARDWSDERARIVLGHELAHIGRHDWLVQMTASLVRAVYWFNPLVWIACRQLRRESEHACDDAVLGLGVEGSEYATHLLELARAFNAHRHTFFPAPAMARPSSLERRVRAMLNAHLNRTPLTRPACALIVGALVAVTLPVASAQSGPAAFSGSLLDAVGRVMPGVTLVLSNPGTKDSHEVSSDQAGHFAFTGLAAGEYALHVSKPGFATTQGRVAVEGGQNLVQDIALQLASLQETITVWEPDGPEPPRAIAPRKSPSQPEFDPCSQSPSGGCIQQPKKLVDVKPVYPPGRLGSGAGGKITFDARIGTDGFVNDLNVVGAADADFAAAAADAIRQWQFSQTRLDGVPMEVRMTILVTFIAH